MESNYYDHIEPNNIRYLIQCKTIEQYSNQGGNLLNNENTTLYNKF